LLPRDRAELKAVPVPDKILTLEVNSVFALAIYTEVEAESAIRSIEVDELPMFKVVVDPEDVPPEAMLRVVSNWYPAPFKRDTVLTLGLEAMTSRPIPLALPVAEAPDRMYTVAEPELPILTSDDEELPMLTVVVDPVPAEPDAMLRVRGLEALPLPRDTVVTRGFPAAWYVALNAVPVPDKILTLVVASVAALAIYTDPEAESAIRTTEEDEFPRLTVVVDPAPVAPEAMFRVRGFDASPLPSTMDVTRGLLPRESAELKAVPVPDKILTLVVASVAALAIYTDPEAESAIRTTEEDEFPRLTVVVDPAPVAPEAMFRVRGFDASPLPSTMDVTRGLLPRESAELKAVPVPDKILTLEVNSVFALAI
jgi:hypothetical protein